MEVKKLIEEYDKYLVYNPEEEREEKETTGKDTYRGQYDGNDLRNMFLGSIQFDSSNAQSIIDGIRKAIDKMPDEWVAEFLRVQNGDVVEPVIESLNEGYELPEDEWYYTHNTDSMYYDISYNVPVKETAKIDAGKGEDGNPEFWFNGNHEKIAGLPYKEQAKLPQTGPYKTVKECMDAYLLWFKAIKKNEGIKLNGMKIGKPYYEKD